MLGACFATPLVGRTPSVGRGPAFVGRLRAGEGSAGEAAKYGEGLFANDTEEDRSMEERTREVPVGPAFVPGDLIGIEMGSLRHRAGLEEVLAVFEIGDAGDEGRTPEGITLRGRLLPMPLQRRYSPGDDVVSRATLSAVVPPGAMPGEYWCRRLEVESRAGHRVPFAPVSEAAWRGWRFRVR